MKSSELLGDLEAAHQSQSRAAAGSAVGRPEAGEVRRVHSVHNLEDSLDLA